MTRFIPTLLSLLLIGACHKESGLIDDPLKPYLESFRQEALSRGITIDYGRRQIEARLQLHSDNVRLGWCDYNYDQPDLIIINTFYWDILDDLEKEKLVFHELGHCVLNRPHLDELRQDGHCKSIMHSGQKCSDDYTDESRSTYLDELFLSR
jgi:hypothetical protein